MDAIYAARQNPKRRPKSASDIGRKPKGAFVKPPTVFGLQYRGLVDSKVEAQYDVLPKWATSTGKTKDIDARMATDAALLRRKNRELLESNVELGEQIEKSRRQSSDLRHRLEELTKQSGEGRLRQEIAVLQRKLEARDAKIVELRRRSGSTNVMEAVVAREAAISECERLRRLLQRKETFKAAVDDKGAASTMKTLDEVDLTETRESRGGGGAAAFMSALHQQQGLYGPTAGAWGFRQGESFGGGGALGAAEDWGGTADLLQTPPLGHESVNNGVALDPRFDLLLVKELRDQVRWLARRNLELETREASEAEAEPSTAAAAESRRVETTSEAMPPSGLKQTGGNAILGTAAATADRTPKQEQEPWGRRGEDSFSRKDTIFSKAAPLETLPPRTPDSSCGISRQEAEEEEVEDANACEPAEVVGNQNSGKACASVDCGSASDDAGLLGIDNSGEGDYERIRNDISQEVQSYGGDTNVFYEENIDDQTDHQSRSPSTTATNEEERNIAPGD